MLFVRQAGRSGVLIVGLLNNSGRVYEFPMGQEFHPTYVGSKLDLRTDAGVIAAAMAVVREGLLA